MITGCQEIKPSCVSACLIWLINPFKSDSDPFLELVPWNSYTDFIKTRTHHDWHRHVFWFTLIQKLVVSWCLRIIFSHFRLYGLNSTNPGSISPPPLFLGFKSTLHPWNFASSIFISVLNTTFFTKFWDCRLLSRLCWVPIFPRFSCLFCQGTLRTTKRKHAILTPTRHIFSTVLDLLLSTSSLTYTSSCIGTGSGLIPMRLPLILRTCLVTISCVPLSLG